MFKMVNSCFLQVCLKINKDASYRTETISLTKITTAKQDEMIQWAQCVYRLYYQQQNKNNI